MARGVNRLTPKSYLCFFTSDWNVGTSSGDVGALSCDSRKSLSSGRCVDWNRQEWWGDHQSLPVPRGGTLVMRSLILHASSKASKPMPRRVLHFVFAPPTMPLDLEWRDAV